MRLNINVLAGGVLGCFVGLMVLGVLSNAKKEDKIVGTWHKPYILMENVHKTK